MRVQTRLRRYGRQARTRAVCVAGADHGEREPQLQVGPTEDDDGDGVCDRLDAFGR